MSAIEVLSYRTHKANAKKRGIGFLLTYQEWLKIWVDSGHLSERGNKPDQYVMARNRDRGPYAVGNVRIITARENSIERSTNKPNGMFCRKYFDDVLDL